MRPSSTRYKDLAGLICVVRSYLGEKPALTPFGVASLPRLLVHCYRRCTRRVSTVGMSKRLCRLKSLILCAYYLFLGYSDCIHLVIRRFQLEQVLPGFQTRDGPEGSLVG